MFRKIALAAALLIAAGTTYADTMYVTEFSGAPPQSVYYQAARVPLLAQQAVAISGVQAQSDAFTDTTGLVRIHCDIPCHINFGINPGVTTGMMRLAAGSTEYFVVPIGASYKVVVISGVAP